jgi:hypothetical protein
LGFFTTNTTRHDERTIHHSAADLIHSVGHRLGLVVSVVHALCSLWRTKPEKRYPNRSTVRLPLV